MFVIIFVNVVMMIITIHGYKSKSKSNKYLF